MVFEFFLIITSLFFLNSFFSCVDHNQKESKDNIAMHTSKLQDNNKCDSVVIGEQIWMIKNLDVSVFRNGDTVFHAKTNEEWINAAKNKIPAWCYFNNNEVNQISNIDELSKKMMTINKQYGKHEEDSSDDTSELRIDDIKKYYQDLNKSLIDCGKLYNWYAVNDPRGLAPEGWSIPTKSDFEQLKKYYGNPYRVNFTLEFTNKYWRGKNENGFNACPCGSRVNNGNFEKLLKTTMFWSLNSKNDDVAYVLSIYPLGGGGSAGDNFTNGVITDYYSNKGNGLSVRCIKK